MTIERPQARELVAPKRKFVLVEDWDNEDGVYDAPKVVSEFVGGEVRSGLW